MACQIEVKIVSIKIKKIIFVSLTEKEIIFFFLSSVLFVIAIAISYLKRKIKLLTIKMELSNNL